MTNDTTTAPEGATPKAVADLARRLRGVYRIPITDGLGPAGGEEPDNPHEFVRRFPSPPIQNDAAAMLEALAADLAAQKARADAAEKARDEDAKDYCALMERHDTLIRHAEAAEAKVARLVEALKGLDGAARELVVAAEAMGMFDNILADFFPDQHVRGNRKADWLKRADAARNNVKAQGSIARAIIAEVQG